jgi:propanol-preferring alcohol dehydrogenase
MLALRLHTPGVEPTLDTIDVPVPTGTEVLLRVKAAGLCHSDLSVIDSVGNTWSRALPFTLGHEIAGQVSAVGDRVQSPAIGDRVAVYGPWGCGSCDRCRSGRDNYCDNRSQLGWAGVGLGQDGGMADYVLVPHERLLVPLDGLDPLDAAPLTDAGLTSYSAVAPLLGDLTPGTTVAVIGAGGLGHIAIQILRACSPTQVIAIDVRAQALALATACGAQHAFPADADAEQSIRAATNQRGVDVVLDFVGSPSSLELSANVLRSAGHIVLVGSGGGELPVKKFGRLPQGAAVSMPFWGSRSQLLEVLQLARAGSIVVHRTVYPLSRAGQAIADLRAGRVDGRAVLVPDRSLAD